MEQSTTGSDVINNIVIIQIPTENLFVLITISWPLIHYYSDCKVTAVLMHYPLKILCMYESGIKSTQYTSALSPLVTNN